jgi:hypothetical protein
MRAHQHIGYLPGCAELREAIHPVVGMSVRQRSEINAVSAAEAVG